MSPTNQQIKPKRRPTLLITSQILLIIILTFTEHSETKSIAKRSTDDCIKTVDEQYSSCVIDDSEVEGEVIDNYLSDVTSTFTTFSDDVNETEEIDDEFFKRFSPQFLSCMHISVASGCYETLDNGSVYVPIYSKIFNESEYFINQQDVLSICPNFFEELCTERKFSNWQAIVSVAGVGVSMVCITLHMLMFLMVPKLRNLPGYCLFSLCVALKMAYVCFFIPMALPTHADCSGLGMMMYYSFLVSFFWMNTMSYDVWRSLRLATAKLRLTGDKPLRVRFGFYSLYSWGTPLFILIVGLVISSVEEETNMYRLEFNDNTCWFKYKQALGVYFAFPIFSLLIVNVGFFIHSSLMISSASMKSSENNTFLWTRFFVSLRLAVVMGLTWIFGVLATATQEHVLFYFYSILTALQGVFIFFSFTLSEKTKKACKMAIKGRQSSAGPSSSQQTTSTSQQVTSF